ncbi:MAG: MAPEG family protein [Pseudomonadota bacterium]
MALPVTAVIAGLMALWLIFLQVRVIRFRRGANVSLGHADDVIGERLIRAHGNAAENVPIFLILLGLCEGFGTPVWLVWLLGLAFIAGRLLHGVHFLKIRKGGLMRVLGMVLTFTTVGVAALSAIGHGLASV